MQFPAALRSLRHRNFRTYFAGQAISMIGTWIQSIANTWLAYRLSGSTAITGLVGFTGQIPMLLVAPFAGVLGDRHDRRRMLFIVQALLIAQSVVLAVLTVSQTITVPLLIALVLMIGLLNAVETPTRQSFYVQLIDEREDLPNAIALNSVLMNGTRLVGPALGGLLIAASSEAACYAVNAVLTVAVLVSLVRLKVTQVSKSTGPARVRSFVGEMKEGMLYAFRSSAIRTLLVMIAVVSFTVSPYVTLMPAIVVVTFKGGSELVGYLIGSVGLGALIGALRLAARKNVRGLASWIAVAAIIAGIASASFSLSHLVWVSMLCMAFVGFGFITVGASINTILQSIVDDDKRSRVVALYTAAFIGAAPLGHLVSGWAAEHIGAPRTFLMNGFICAAAGLVFAARLARFRDALRPLYIKRGIIPPPPAEPHK
jgi:MFS family permease